MQSVKELLGIVLFRFRPLSRIWATVLIFVNLGSLFFLDTVYGKIALAAVIAGIVIMVVIHMRLRFVRLLGIGHLFWIPMIIWFLQNPPENESVALQYWFWSLVAFNWISLVIDGIDVIRFCRGEREPHYRW